MYRITKLEFGGTEYAVNPRWDDEAAIVLRRDSEYRLLREEIEGDIIFQREDYDLIMGEAFDTKFELIIETDASGTWAERLRAFFYRTYCEIDEDNETITVQKYVTTDKYEAVLGGIDKEFNLVTVGTEITPVKYNLTPILQVYIAGSAFLTNINGGTSWETPVSTVTTSQATLENDYKFLRSTDIHFIPGSSQLQPDVSGNYDFISATPEYTDGTHTIQFNGGTNRWEIRTVVGGTLYFEGTIGESDINATVFESVLFPASPDAKFYTWEVYSRLVTNAATVDGNPTVAMPDPDIIPQQELYENVIGLDIDTHFASDDNTSTPTEYGKFSDSADFFAGEYFAFPPNPSVSQHYYPLNLSDFEFFSAWMFLDPVVRGYIEDGQEVKTIEDAYKFADALSAILAQLDSTVTYAEDTDHSLFLNDASNVIRGKMLYPFLVPKTNVTVGNYDQPAKKAPIRLVDLLNIIKFAWNADWYIDSAGRFRIEHISWFEKGGSYSADNEGTDISALLEPKTETAWSFNTNRYTFDLAKMPERYEFAWQEEQSLPFDGFPIEIRSAFVEIGNNERQVVGNMSPDLDFVLISPGTTNGFVFLECEFNSPDYEVPVIPVQAGNLKNYRLNNGYASLIYCHNTYWKHNLPASDVTINQEDTTATSVKRNKVQELDFAGSTEWDYYSLLRTGQGVMEMEEININLASGVIAVTGKLANA